jgi:DNA-binding CsgD family transcriptional regulator
LTPREGEVVRLLLRGYSTKAAAARLGIAVATTALHRKRAYIKLRVCSQAELFYLFLCSFGGAEAMQECRLPRDADTPAHHTGQPQPDWAAAVFEAS